MFVIRNGSHLSLDSIHQLQRDGASVLRSAHLGNFNPATLFLAQEGFDVILDEHIIGNFRGYKPGTMKVGSREFVLADDLNTPLTHMVCKTGTESEIGQFVSRTVSRPSQVHYESLRRLYPNNIKLTSSFLLEQEIFLREVLEVLIVKFPEVFRKYVSSEGRVYHFSYASKAGSFVYTGETNDDIKIDKLKIVEDTLQYFRTTRDSIISSTHPMQGIVLSPVADILLLTICDLYKARVGVTRYRKESVSVIHFAGVEMMNYLIKNTTQAKENSQKFNDFYKYLYSLFTDRLPERVDFFLVPTNILAQVLTDDYVLAGKRSQTIELSFQIDSARAAASNRWINQSEQARSEIETFSEKEIKVRVQNLYSRRAFLPKRVRAQVLRAVNCLDDVTGNKGFLLSILTKQRLFENSAYPKAADSFSTVHAVQEKLRAESVSSCPREVLDMSQYDVILGRRLFFPESARKLSQDDLQRKWRSITNLATREINSTRVSFESRYDFVSIRENALKGPRVTSLLPTFERIASGDIMAPKVPVPVSPKFLAQHAEYKKYYEMFSRNIGAFNMHAFASIPFLMEQNIRTGVALYAMANNAKKHGTPYLTMYSTSSADDTHGRTLAEYSNGLVKTFSDSPNPANALQFQKYLSHKHSFHHTGPFVDITREFLLEKKLTDFADGFDIIWENTTFQMYGNNRDEQIAYVRRILKRDGVMIFLEKLNQENRQEYERRESIKDKFFKSKYFTEEEVARKKSSILSEMEKGQVTLPELSQEIKKHFAYVHLIWNSANFYEIVASNSRVSIDLFLSLLPEPFVPSEFACETPMVRTL